MRQKWAHQSQKFYELYEVIADEGESRINYRLIEIESE